MQHVRSVSKVRIVNTLQKDGDLYLDCGFFLVLNANFLCICGEIHTYLF